MENNIIFVNGCLTCPFSVFNTEDDSDLKDCNHPDMYHDNSAVIHYDSQDPLPMFCPLRMQTTTVKLR